MHINSKAACRCHLRPRRGGIHSSGRRHSQIATIAMTVGAPAFNARHTGSASQVRSAVLARYPAFVALIQRNALGWLRTYSHVDGRCRRLPRAKADAHQLAKDPHEI
jgi:hypothetical protein